MAIGEVGGLALAAVRPCYGDGVHGWSWYAF